MPTGAERLLWLVSYLTLEIQCDTPIVEALLWSRNWAYFDHIRRTPVPMTIISHDPARNLTRLTNGLVIHKHRTVVGRWNSTTQTVQELTTVEQALAEAMGYKVRAMFPLVSP